MDILVIVILVLGVTIHEFAHALAADRLGDPTPRYSGRLTLNPLSHLDLIGSLMFLFARFGWGKPVPIDPFNFRSPRRDETLVALAGPLSNIILALFLAILNTVIPQYGPLLYLAALLNLNLAFFNLLPLPSLDGSHILLNLLPPKSSLAFRQTLNQYGFYILLALFLLPLGSGSLISQLVYPPVNFVLSLLF